MSIIFKESDHSYTSTDGSNIKWNSVTGLVSKFKIPFNADLQAEKASKNKKSKWYGISVKDILQIWKNETNRSLKLGSWYHNEQETELCNADYLMNNELKLPIHKPIIKNDLKYAPEQKLREGIYPEHLVYSKSEEVCGQADKVIVSNGVVDIDDYKTNKEIKMSSYVNWQGKSSKMLDPISHIDDCNFYHYSLQLSLYMYFILKHNSELKAGRIRIQHVIFEESGKDAYNYPITSLNNEGYPIVKDTIYYEVPYLESEVISMLKYHNKY